jgi:hypothetical protein
MPAERVGSSPGGQGKAVTVEETAVQFGLPIATAENPKGATRRRTRDRLGAIRAGAPRAIDNAGIAVPATMEEVAKRLTSALLKVASNKGAPGPHGRMIEALLEQWPTVLLELEADLLAGMYQPGGIRRVYIPKAGGGERGLGIPQLGVQLGHQITNSSHNSGTSDHEKARHHARPVTGIPPALCAAVSRQPRTQRELHASTAHNPALLIRLAALAVALQHRAGRARPTARPAWPLVRSLRG